MSTVYALQDPRDGRFRYVGVTENAKVRYYDHMGGGSGKARMEWLRDLKMMGVSPRLVLIEEHADRVRAEEREAYWIQELLECGAWLTNTQGVPTWAQERDPVARLTRALDEAERSLEYHRQEVARLEAAVERRRGRLAEFRSGVLPV